MLNPASPPFTPTTSHPNQRKNFIHQKYMQQKQQCMQNRNRNRMNDHTTHNPNSFCFKNSNSFYFKSSNSLYFKNSTLNDPLYDYTNQSNPITPIKHNTPPVETLSTLQLTPIDLNSPKQIQIENFENTYLDR